MFIYIEDSSMNRRQKNVTVTTVRFMLIACLLLCSQLRTPCLCTSCANDSNSGHLSDPCGCSSADCGPGDASTTDSRTHSPSVASDHDSSGLPKQCTKRQLVVAKPSSLNSPDSNVTVTARFSDITHSPPAVNGLELAFGRVNGGKLFELATIRIRI